MIIDTILLPALMAAAAGLVGCFAVMRRMALAGDALSHVALPGIGVALALHIHPLFGATAMLFFGAFLVWTLERQTGRATETVVGVVFSAALAIGSMLTSGEDLIDALLGKPGTLSIAEVIFGLASAALVIVFILMRKNQLIVSLVSTDLARASGIKAERLHLIYLEMFALTVALGLRYLGVLLMGSLIIIPAATAMRWSRNLTQMMVLASAIAIATTVGGTIAAIKWNREPGPIIVTFSAAVFLLTLGKRGQ